MIDEASQRKAMVQSGISNRILRLSSNEGPLGLCEAAKQAAIDHVDYGSQYPGQWRHELSERLADKHRVTLENVIVGAGSTEVLQVAVRSMTAPDRPLILAHPTFTEIPSYQETLSCQMLQVPLDHRHAHDIERMHALVESHGNKAVVYICNPNNPTGTLTPSAEIDHWIQEAPAEVFFIVDEAYHDFVEDPAYSSALKWIEDRPNVIVVRTFSKIFGMAGLRVGYGIAHPRTAADLSRFISYESNSVVSLAAGIASLKDSGHIERTKSVNKESKRLVHEVLDELGLEYLPSHTNFLMHKINGDLETYILRFLERGIAVGPPFPPMMDYNRVSFSTPDRMVRWAETIKDFRARGWV